MPGYRKRDYLGDADLRDAETVLAQLGGWVEDYNTQAPHSALGMRSPREYRARPMLEVRTAATARPRDEIDAGVPRECNGLRSMVR